MTYQILVDRSSVRHNPDAGRTDYHYPIGQTRTKKTVTYDSKTKMTTVRSYVGSGEEYIMTGWQSVTASSKSTIDDEVTTEERFNEHLRDLRLVAMAEQKALAQPGVEIVAFENIQNHYEHVQSMYPAAALLYSYHKTAVTCSECGHVCMHDQLESDEAYVGDGDSVWMENMCPKCKAADCCDITYEKLSKENLSAIADANEAKL